MEESFYSKSAEASGDRQLNTYSNDFQHDTKDINTVKKKGYDSKFEQVNSYLGSTNDLKYLSKPVIKNEVSKKKNKDEHVIFVPGESEVVHKVLEEKSASFVDAKSISQVIEISDEKEAKRFKIANQDLDKFEQLPVQASTDTLSFREEFERDMSAAFCEINSLTTLQRNSVLQKRENVGAKPFSGVRGIYFQQGLWKVKYKNEHQESFRIFPYKSMDEMKYTFQYAKKFLKTVIDKGRQLHDSDGEGLSNDELAWENHPKLGKMRSSDGLLPKTKSSTKKTKSQKLSIQKTNNDVPIPEALGPNDHQAIGNPGTPFVLNKPVLPKKHKSAHIGADGKKNNEKRSNVSSKPNSKFATAAKEKGFFDVWMNPPTEPEWLNRLGPRHEKPQLYLNPQNYKNSPESLEISRLNWEDTNQEKSLLSDLTGFPFLSSGSSAWKSISSFPFDFLNRNGNSGINSNSGLPSIIDSSFSNTSSQRSHRKTRRNDLGQNYEQERPENDDVLFRVQCRATHPYVSHSLSTASTQAYESQSSSESIEALQTGNYTWNRRDHEQSNDQDSMVEYKLVVPYKLLQSSEWV